MVFQFLKMSYAKVSEALSKARSFFSDALRKLFKGPIDESVLEQLEQHLYEADFGVKTSVEIVEKIRTLAKSNPHQPGEFYLNAVQKELVAELKLPEEKKGKVDHPEVWLIVGVNGNGKTTSVAKLAHLFQKQGKKVLIGAADTFRAAATEQLEIWAGRLGIEIVKGSGKGGDPAAVVFDALTAAKSRKIDIVLVDTAGRLHTKSHLMQELEKIERTCKKVCPGAPHETLLVLDATVGQNAIDQAKQFHLTTPLSGLILTKLDGTARGGIVVAIQRELKIPIRFVGTGEKIEDLEPFDPVVFVQGLFT